jgi:hypothetical protein
MKKVALSLLAFVLVGALAVAQDAPTLKLSGYLNTGVAVGVVGSIAQAQIYGDDAGNAWGRFDLNGAYGTDTNGVNWRLRTDADGKSPAIKYAYAWSKFADGMVTVKAGRVDDGTFSTAGDIGDDLTDANSILVIASPVAGLSVGASYFATVNASDPLAYAFHGAFTADQLAKVEAGLKVSNSKLSEVVAGGALLSVDKLTLAVDTHITQLDNDKAVSLSKISQNVVYAVTDALSVGVLAYEYVYGADAKYNLKNPASTKTDAFLGYNVKPNVSYTVDPVISLGAGVKYAVGQQGGAWTDATVATWVLNDASFIEVNPSATFTLSSAAKIIASYTLDYSLDKDKLSYYVSDITKTEQLAHTIKLDFRYNF